jgi:hypothetical protein
MIDPGTTITGLESMIPIFPRAGTVTAEREMSFPFESFLAIFSADD